MDFDYQTYVVQPAGNLRNHIRSCVSQTWNIMDEEYETIDISFPYSEAKQISMAQRNVEVIDRNYLDDRINLKIKGSKERIKKILNKY